jgi:hypothetical protein
MDSNDRRHRQSNPSGYASQQGLIQTSPQYPATSGSERFRQQPHLAVQSPTSAPAAGRGGNLPGYSYPYGAEGAQFGGPAMNAGPMQYPAEYGPDTGQRAQQQQQPPYQQYGSNIMYNVPSQQQQPSPQSPYETVQPYQPRQTAALEVLTNQFAVPQQYYEGGPTSAPASAITAQNVPSQYAPLSYTTQSPVGREPLTSAYATGMADANQGSSQGAYGQTNYAASELDNAYGQYQTELKRTFESIRDGRLGDAGSSLIHISDWLLGNAEALGMFNRPVRCAERATEIDCRSSTRRRNNASRQDQVVGRIQHSMVISTANAEGDDNRNARYWPTTTSSAITSRIRPNGRYG